MTKNDAGPAATEPSVQNDSSDQVYASRQEEASEKAAHPITMTLAHSAQPQTVPQP
jgi:hypothetical protein